MTEFKIDWNKIKKEYPKVYDKFERYLKEYEIDKIIKLDFFCKEIIFKIYSDINDDYYESDEIPFEMLYGIIESFFDSLGIIITIDFLPYMIKGKWSFTIKSDTDQIYLQEKMLQSRHEAKIEAVYMAFKIAEEMEDKKWIIYIHNHRVRHALILLDIFIEWKNVMKYVCIKQPYMILIF